MAAIYVIVIIIIAVCHSVGLVHDLFSAIGDRERVEDIQWGKCSLKDFLSVV